MADMSDISRLNEPSTFNQVCSYSASALRIGLQYGFLPYVIYLGNSSFILLSTPYNNNF